MTFARDAWRRAKTRRAGASIKSERNDTGETAPGQAEAQEFLVARGQPWVASVLTRHLWSFAGDGDREDVNQSLFQPFVNYNLPDGWYLVSSPVVMANWRNNDANTWLVPVGGGAGRVFTVGDPALNAHVQSFYNVERPKFAPEWSLRVQMTFLFPR